MATFDRQEWVSQAKKWEDIPKSVKHSRHNCVENSAGCRHMICRQPAKFSISIHAVVYFTLPRPTSAVQNASDTSGFFSNQAPDAVNASMIICLHHLDMPPITVIRRLIQDGKQAWLDGYTSVKYGHISGDALTHFPLWLISFWNDVIDIRLHVRKPWNDARDWVKKQMGHKKNSDVRKHATETSRLLGILPWNGSKRGLSDVSPIHTFWRYLGPEWLSSTDENDMLEMLREKITSEPELVGSVRVEVVEFTAKVTAAFKDHSFGEKIPPPLREAYEWWGSKHTADVIRFGTLPTSMQTDGYSCGMFAGKAAERAVYPATPFLEQADVVKGRLQMFNRIANGILDRIADEEEDMDEGDNEAPAVWEQQAHMEPMGILSPPPAFAAKFSFLALKLESNTLKHTEGHPDEPTPTASPEKKRFREVTLERSLPPPLRFESELPAHHQPSDQNRGGIPALADVFGSTKTVTRHDPEPDLATSKQRSVKQSKLGSFFKVATQEEKEANIAREWERLRDNREVWEAREREAKFEAKLKMTADAAERKRRSWTRLRDAKIASGWVPATAGCNRKIIELEDHDKGPSASSSKLAEDSRHRRQFIECAKKNNKPQGHKRKPENAPTVAKRVNWHNPLIFPLIELAVLKAGRPWSATEIYRQAKLFAPDVFENLTSQVIGRWIDLERMPLDVRVQRPMKQSMKCSAHRDVVEEASALLRPEEGEEAVDPTILKLDTTRGTLRNRCIGWIVDAFHVCNNKDLTLKVSLTSPAALAALRDLPKTNPTLHLELTGLTTPPEEIENEDLFSKDEEDLTYNDESDVLAQVVINHVVSRGAADLPDGFKLDSDKNLV
ncbi:hypothetical protein B0H10DRAFT_2197604 [Mycena sp. CBHHK59/15]|nr:hypothetical protein B0H10DRAFT_2197604 [Mycena sp. CBHHK59/15]